MPVSYLYNKEPQPQKVSRVFFKDWFMHHINSSLENNEVNVLTYTPWERLDYTLWFTKGNGTVTHQNYKMFKQVLQCT